jgi:hypothetical protein
MSELRRFQHLARIAVASALSAWSAGCTTIAACDIRESDCQASIYAAVLDLRGEPWDAWANPPPMSVMTEAEFRSWLERNAQGASGSSQSPWDPAYKLLGFLAPASSSSQSSIDSLVANALAFYSEDSRSVTIIDRGAPGDTLTSSRVLAHELVHALQDRDVGLGAYRKVATSSDQLFALRSMIEGEASFYEVLFYLEAKDLSLEDVDWDAYFANYRAQLGSQLATSSAPLSDTVTQAVYPLGAAYMQKAYDQGGSPAVEAAFLSKPSSMAEVTKGYGAPRLGSRPLSCRAPAAPEGFSRMRVQILGALGLYAFAVKTASFSAAWDLTGAWADDDLSLYTSADGHTAVAWSVRLTGPDGARTLQSIAASLGARIAAGAAQDEWIIAGADLPSALSGWALNRCAP